MKKHIVFDFDGTLVDSVDVVVKVYNGLALKYKFNTLNSSDYRMMMNLSLKEKIKALNVPMRRVFLIKRFSQEFKNNYSVHLKSLRFFDGVVDVIKQLNEKGYTISIITSNSKANILEYMEHQEVSYFKQVMSSNGLFGKDKTLKKYMKDNQLHSSELMYIGDEVRDIQACKKKNVEVIAVTWGVDPREALVIERPDHLADEPKDILRILQSNL
ncbi:HAD hydrolase-like protein [Paenibacillus sp. EC2-1]|uniref:HAD hydrolase-like protein n=1 Tax=Paenibacillus sp. EC2-1 TaxID=3388665 RepID=UPI003BEEE384